MHPYNKGENKGGPMTKVIGAGVLSFFVSSFLMAPIAAAKDYVVKFRNINAFEATSKTLNAENSNTISELNAVVVSEADLKNMQVGPEDVEYVEPVQEVHINAPTVLAKWTEVSNLWGMEAIKVSDAWVLSKGLGVTVAVSDTGVWIHHADLQQQMQLNTGEMGLDANGKDKAKNKIDDDGNGFVDDVYGWDFSSKRNGDHDNHYHGTHVAGTIAGALNGSGIAGVAPEAKILVSAFLNSQGSGTDANGAASIIYAANNGAKIINCSWSGAGESKILDDAILYAQSKNVLIVAAAGNDGINTDKTATNPKKIQMPMASIHDNVISVGATSGSGGDIVYFSNFGALTVDVAAPGFEIMSSVNPGMVTTHMPFEKLSGTSMAAPHVSGIAALVWSIKPSLTWKQVKEIIMNSVDLKKSWNGKSVTGGVVRADKAVALAKTY
jgi:subtilisin family serine protease